MVSSKWCTGKLAMHVAIYSFKRIIYTFERINSYLYSDQLFNFQIFQPVNYLTKSTQGVFLHVLKLQQRQCIIWNSYDSPIICNTHALLELTGCAGSILGLYMWNGGCLSTLLLHALSLVVSLVMTTSFNFYIALYAVEHWILGWPGFRTALYYHWRSSTGTKCMLGKQYSGILHGDHPGTTW